MICDDYFMISSGFPLGVKQRRSSRGRGERVGLRKMIRGQHRRQDSQMYLTVTVTQRRRKRRTWKVAKVEGTRRVQDQKGSNRRMDRRGKGCS